jgi:serine/threonine protein kinase
VRVSIADFEVVASWPGRDGRFVCRPPERLAGPDLVMVSELAVDAEGWQQLCDWLIRLASAPGGGLLEVIEVGPDLQTGGVFLVSEAAAGGTLAEPEEPTDRRRRVDAVAAAARAAHALHEVGLAHGSIHPGTILFGGRGPVLDVPGLDASPGQVTRVGRWQELVAIDPELLGGETPSRHSDIWSLGATVHTVMSGRPLFPGVEEDEAVTAVQRVMFTRPEPDPALPAPLRELIDACLAPDPADRPQSALAVADQLAGIEVPE